ncbi:MAG: 3-(3-hydroxyphenyl)propionate hydroxylase [Rhodospirillaceae bacterium]|nr:3-(3-hydroxyphenyl)propionate hydroxylase [Rhodospirillaceae bacterium]
MISKADLPSETEVVIVGAGPVGLVMANLLGLSRVATTLIERNQRPYDIPRAITLDDEGCRTLQATGLDHIYLPKALPGKGARYYGEDGTPFAEVGPGPIEFGFSRRTHFFQPDLEATLLSGLNRFCHVNVFYSCELMDIIQTETNVTANVKDHSGKLKSLTCNYLVGTDGARSRVRQKLGIKMLGDTYPEDWVIIDTLNDPDDEPVSKFFCSREKPFVSIPAPNNGRRYEFRTHADENAEALLKFDNIRERLKPIREIKEKDILRATIYTFEAKIAEKWQDRRIFLAGDAAHLTPPFAGQGLNSGLRDAHNLAWKLSIANNHKARDSFLTTYELERRAPAWAMIELAIAMGDIVMPRGGDDVSFRNSLVRWLERFPATRDFIVSMKFKPPPRYEMGAFINLFSQPFAGSLVGEMLPQTPVRHLNCSSTRLDDVIGNNFALIAQEEWMIKQMVQKEKELWPELKPKMIGIGKNLVDISDHVIRLVPTAESTLPKLRAHRDQIILLRPDRYVAASFTQDEAASTVSQLRDILWHRTK